MFKAAVTDQSSLLGLSSCHAALQKACGIVPVKMPSTRMSSGSSGYKAFAGHHFKGQNCCSLPTPHSNFSGLEQNAPLGRPLEMPIGEAHSLAAKADTVLQVCFPGLLLIGKTKELQG